MASNLEFVNYKQFVENLPVAQDYAPGDKTVVSNGANGPRQMPHATNEQIAAQNALAGNVAPEFDAEKYNGYAKNELVVNGGKLYMFTVAHLGAWTSDDVIQVPFCNVCGYELSNGCYGFQGTITDSDYRLVKALFVKGKVVHIKFEASSNVNLVCVESSGQNKIISTGTSGDLFYLVTNDIQSFGFYVYRASQNVDVSLTVKPSLVVSLDGVYDSVLQCITKNNLQDFDIPVESGGYIRSNNGQLTSSDYGRFTDYIPTKSGDKFRVFSKLSSAGAVIACYSLDKTYLITESVVIDGVYNSIFIVPSGVAFVRFSGYVGGADPEPSFKNIATLDLTNVIGNAYLATDYYLDKSFTIYSRNYIRPDNGQLTWSENGRYTDYISVSVGDKIHVNCFLSNGGAKVACYTSDKTYIQQLSLITEGIYDGVFVVPAGVSFIRCSGYVTSTLPEPQFIKLCPKSFAPKNENLKILVFGDSISEDFSFVVDNGYTESVTQTSRFAWSVRANIALKFGELRNYSKAGATYKNNSFGSWNRLSVSEQVLLAINDKLDPNGVWGDANFEPDIIVFAAGTNDGEPNDTPESALSKIVYDSEGSVDAETTLSSLDRSKFCESVMWSMLKIRLEFPYSLGLCVLPIQRCSNDIPFGNINNYLTTMARRYGFIPIDGISECGIIKDNNVRSASGDTLADGLHPNATGNKMMARMMVQAIDRYYYPINSL